MKVTAEETPIGYKYMVGEEAYYDLGYLLLQLGLDESSNIRELQKDFPKIAKDYTVSSY